MQEMVRLEFGGVQLDELPDVLTPPQVAKILQCSAEMVYAMCRRQQLPCFKVGRLVRIPKDDLVTWIREG